MYGHQIKPATVKTLAFAICGATLAMSCSRPVAEFSAGTPCDAGTFVVSDEFSGARRGDCEVYSDGTVQLHIVPENEGPINDSPWYSFKIIPKQQVEAEITLRYHGGNRRYRPKISFDDATWHGLDDSAVDVNWFESAATIKVPLTDRPIWVSAQMLILPSDMQDWMDVMSSGSPVTKTLIGTSTQGKPVHKLDINSESPNVIFLVGRQHPPEVTGSYGFLGFYEAIVQDNEVANEFRRRFHIVAIPMLNPDGVVAGNWRHNSNGIDLNRDWGPFSQAETRLVEELLDGYEKAGKQVRFFVDFHSTEFNLMYTQSDADITNPEGMTNKWVAAALPRLRDYEFTQEKRPLTDRATSKNYMFKRYGIPAVTFEVADEEDRTVAMDAAGVFAEELMRLLNDDSIK